MDTFQLEAIEISRSFPLNPIFLPRGASACSGGDGDLGDGGSELAVVDFRGLVRTSTTLVCWIPVVWWEGARSQGWNRGRFRYRLRPAVQLYWDQLPNSTRLEVSVIRVVHLGCRYFSGDQRNLSWGGTDWCTIFFRPVTGEVPSQFGRAPEKAGTVIS